jgi:hypothetical protein
MGSGRRPDGQRRAAMLRALPATRVRAPAPQVLRPAVSS